MGSDDGSGGPRRAGEPGGPRTARGPLTGDDASAVVRLTAALAAAAGSGTPGPTPRELAELLWLAQKLATPGSHREAPEKPTPAGRPAPAPVGVSPHPAPRPKPGPPPAPPPPPAPDGRIPLHLPERTGTPTTQLLAPAPPMLPHPLALQRALRPLKRRVPAPPARVLDELATADRIARLGARPDVWLPVLRPALDRWLRLNLVYDTGPTMPVWRPLVRELHTVLAQSGVFRTVTLHLAGPDGRAHHVPALADGRTVTLVISDCMGPQWRPGPAGERWYRTLRRWATRMPLAVVQPLPERLWPTTALPAEPGLLTAPSTAAPSSMLAFTPYDPDAPRAPASALTLPVLEPGPAWLANWAALIADPGGARMPGAAARLPPAPTGVAEPSRPDIASLPPRDLVLHFRATASPEAFRLAGHLSLAVPSLPVMRLVQRALEGSPRPQHLAEVILSGMLTTVPGPPGSYAFRPGVRDLLLRTLPRTARGRTREFLARVGGLIDEQAGLTAGEFRAEAGGGGAVFATVSEETVRRLGGSGAGEGLVLGRYRPVEARIAGQRMWEAVDVRTERRVVVHRYPEQTSGPDLFLRQAAVLAELRHPNVVPVVDFGMEGEQPYMVAEFIEGVTVAELESGSGPGVSAGVHERVRRGVESGLQAIHARGLVRGPEGWDGVLLKPYGTAVLTRFTLGEQSVHHSVASDPQAFRDLLEGLARREPDAADTGWTEPLHITLLGPPRLGHNPVPSPEALAMLSMLVLRQGCRVPSAELASGLWEQPPAEPDTAVRHLSLELRRLLGPGTIARARNHYALHAPDAYVDVLQCEMLLASRTQDLRARRTTVQQVLALWYGDPLADIPGPAARATRTRLRALRLTLCATRAELDLELGDFTQAAADLAPLIQEHPDRQDFRRLHILALKGQGRITEAIEAYESYEEHWQRQYTDPLDPTFQELYRDLRTAPERSRPTIVFEISGGEDPYDTLGQAVTSLLARGDLPTHQYEVLARDNGYVVLTEPEAHVLPVLVAVLRRLPGHLAALDDPPQVRVTFWHSPWFAGPGQPVVPPQVQGVLDDSSADVTVVVSPTLHEEFANSSAADAGRFQPLWTGDQTSPVAWYCPLHLSPPQTESRDLVRGAFRTGDVTRLDPPEPGRTAVVLSPPDGPLTLLDPAHPWGRRPPRPMAYYEVDLTVHQAAHSVSLPSSGGGAFAASVKLSWHVDDPVAFVRAETENVSEILLEHLLKEAARITRRHPLRRAGAAQQALRSGLRKWPVPGLSVTCSVGLTPEGDPAPAPQTAASQTRPPSHSPLTTVLRGAETVLIGFDGPLTRLFTTRAARSAALELLSLAVEDRDPADALEGRPLTGPGGPIPLQEELVHPLEVLRAFAGSSLGPDLRRRLDDLELRAVRNTYPTPDAHALIRALNGSGRRVEVVTDVSKQAALRCLGHHGLPQSNVHGRSENLALLMPNPDCLLRALKLPGRPTPTGLLLTSSAAEHTAATRLGLRCIGYADIPATERRLRKAGCEEILTSLEPLLDAARAL
ncbi:serine/threonine protein kinase (regulator) [Streptomyces lincolnensis]|uniref:Serine/threonine protein kinase (Regulator) n=1 Tax=Streptomyces lincolnensis TaxID=1915 RepID=A0A1B1M8R6_STRLN|nr:SAV_2336 N-terminal domain-related protein [Streptomyces lincolnensis]ANS65025.1 serine/threonine protein kinase (regulator) [Streptomyces lincolnensis]AXG56767.1 serine/threonine protein kinase (regulator) [Streptomyces lincolnensis]QMV06816.1 serine/threonine protein kinase [Streptomyces lincolnensis]